MESWWYFQSKAIDFLSTCYNKDDSGWSISELFALLSDKARMIYNRIFDAIKGIQTNLAPDTIMVGFELALCRSIRDAGEDVYFILLSASTERFFYLSILVNFY